MALRGSGASLDGFAMDREKTMPSLLNRICAHPMIISWGVGAIILDAALLAVVFTNASLHAIATDGRGMFCLGAALFAATLLGFFLGMFTCWPVIRFACSRHNGGALRAGDEVLILTGPHRGKRTRVYEMIVGQGGWSLARLNLGSSAQRHHTYIFEVYSLLNIRKNEPPKAPA